MPRRKVKPRARGKGRVQGQRRSHGGRQPDVGSLEGEVRELRRRLERVEASVEAMTAAVGRQRPEAPSPDAQRRTFYDRLVRVHHRHATPLGTSPIPEVRREVCTSLGMEAADFDEALVACWLQGLVTLEPGSPIGQAPGGHLNYRGRRYYYLRLAS